MRRERKSPSYKNTSLACFQIESEQFLHDPPIEAFKGVCRSQTAEVLPAE
jgi:hypothetical protein